MKDGSSVGQSSLAYVPWVGRGGGGRKQEEGSREERKKKKKEKDKSRFQPLPMRWVIPAACGFRVRHIAAAES